MAPMAGQPFMTAESPQSDGHLIIQSMGGDPYLAAPVRLGNGGFVVRIRMRSRSTGQGQFFWASTSHPATAANRVVTFRVDHDGQWHEYQTRFNTEADLISLRLDPSTAPGEIEVDWISIHDGKLHPLRNQ